VYFLSENRRSVYTIHIIKSILTEYYFQVIIIDLLGDDGITKTDARWLSLLTEQAILSGETLKSYHFHRCTSDERLLQTIISSKKIIPLLCEELKETYMEETGVLVESEIEHDFICELLKIQFGMDESEEE